MFFLSFSLLWPQCAALESIFPQSQTSKSFWVYLCRHEWFLYETKIFTRDKILLLKMHASDANIFIQVHFEFDRIPVAATDSLRYKLEASIAEKENLWEHWSKKASQVVWWKIVRGKKQRMTQISILHAENPDTIWCSALHVSSLARFLR